MQQTDVPSAESSQGMITDLISLSRTDTLYNDHYTQRARSFLAKELSLPSASLPGIRPLPRLRKNMMAFCVCRE